MPPLALASQIERRATPVGARPRSVAPGVGLPWARAGAKCAALALLALALVACGADAEVDDGLGADDTYVPPGLASLTAIPTPWHPGYRALVGIPGEAKALVSQDGTIAPMGRVSPPSKTLVVRLQLRPFGGDALFEMTPLDAGLPIPVLTTVVDGVTVSATVFAAPVGGKPAVLAQVHVAGAGEVTLDLALNAEPAGLSLDGDALSSPELALLRAWSRGPLRVEALGAGLRCALTLDAEREGDLWLVLPSGLSPDQLAAAGPIDGPALLAEARAGWTQRLGAGSTIELPDPWLAAAWRASLATVLLLRDRVGDLYVVKPGAVSYNSFWYRDAAYIVRALDVAGLPTEAEESLRLFWRHPLPDAVNAMGTWGSTIEQKPDGRWEAPDDEWDGPGQALWALVGHYELTGDTDFLQAVYPAIRAGVAWLRGAREAQGGPDHGLLPAGYGEALLSWGRVLYHDYWGVLGLREAARAAATLGEGLDAGVWRAAADSLRGDVATAAGAAFVEQPGGGVLPAAVGEPASRLWGTIAAVWPCDALDAHAPTIEATFQRMWKDRVWDLYRFTDKPDKVWTYITADWAQALLVRGEWERATTLLEGYRAVASPVHGWWEELYVSSGQGTGDHPHGWAAANLILWVRALLVAEAGDGELALLRGAPPAFFVDGSPIRMADLPTERGLLRSLVAESDGDTLTVTVDLDARAPGTHLLLYRRGATFIDASCDVTVDLQGDHALLWGPRARCVFELAAAPPG